MKKPQFFKRKKADIDKSKSSFSSDLPDHIVILDSEKFYDFILKYPISIIDFWAPWCIPCQKMSPRFRRLSTVYKGKLAFGKINTVDNKNIALENKINQIPYFGFYSYGKKISSITGLKSVGEIKKEIDQLIKKWSTK
jgi:thioredoxin 1